jgi:hypothetical protein
LFQLADQQEVMRRRLEAAVSRVATQDYGYPAHVEARDPRGGLKRLDLGYYTKMEQAKHACERHYAAGCDLRRAEKIVGGE